MSIIFNNQNSAKRLQNGEVGEGEGGEDANTWQAYFVQRAVHNNNSGDAAYEYGW